MFCYGADGHSAVSAEWLLVGSDWLLFLFGTWTVYHGFQSVCKLVGTSQSTEPPGSDLTLVTPPWPVEKTKPTIRGESGDLGGPNVFGVSADFLLSSVISVISVIIGMERLKGAEAIVIRNLGWIPLWPVMRKTWIISRGFTVVIRFAFEWVCMLEMAKKHQALDALEV